MSPKFSLNRGDVVVADLRGAEGTEKLGVRPCVVVQNDVGNKHSPLTIIVPVTDEAQFKNLPVQVPIPAAELGPDGKNSIAECGHVRAIDRDARIHRKISTLSHETMLAIDQALRVSLGLAMGGSASIE